MIVLVTGEENWTSYSGNGMKFDYPVNWRLIESPTGVVLGDNWTFALSLTMHDEGCYPLTYHPHLMDYLLKLWMPQMFGTPYGDPITLFFETDIGPYSMGQQLYKNPSGSLICELQGYTAKNVTISFAEAIWEPLDPAWKEANLNIGRLKKSLVITEGQTNPII